MKHVNHASDYETIGKEPLLTAILRYWQCEVYKSRYDQWDVARKVERSQFHTQCEKAKRKFRDEAKTEELKEFELENESVRRVESMEELERLKNEEREMQGIFL